MPSSSIAAMQIVTSIAEMRRLTRDYARRGLTVGFVPTMGALHAGHLSLVARSRRECDITIASIFVNPLQFAANEDYARYPRTFHDDSRQLESAGVTALFAPSADEMYPAGSNGNPENFLVQPGPLGSRLDGASRPGHFTGVATVVAKLFHIVAPTRAYFGQKDAAQVAVLRRMVRDLNFDVELVACPIIREADGLAMSSRNRYLSPAERRDALVLHRAIGNAAMLYMMGESSADALIAAAQTEFALTPAARIDYITLVDPDTLLPLKQAAPGALFAVAAYLGNTRLIDNWLIGQEL